MIVADMPRCKRCGHQFVWSNRPIMAIMWRRDGLVVGCYTSGCGCECVPDSRLDEWRAKAGA